MDDSYYQELLSRVDNTIAESQQSSHTIYAGAYYDDSPRLTISQYSLGHHTILGPFISRGEYMGLSRCATLYHALAGFLGGMLISALVQIIGSIPIQIILVTILLDLTLMGQTFALLKLMKREVDVWRALSGLLVLYFGADILIFRLIGSQKVTPSIGIFMISYLCACLLEFLLRVFMFKFKRFPSFLDPSNPINHQYHHQGGPIGQEEDYASL
mmetsp:Transcript_26673/g.48503  ORF Transcript_26673/g.48503 Transcript_26673/m.48503 type:complete len:214 (+) Transcript_26673:52-693(+)